MKLIFLDFDGVLLPTRAHILPENWRRIGRLASSGEYPREERYPADYDPIATGLVNRLSYCPSCPTEQSHDSYWLAFPACFFLFPFPPFIPLPQSRLRESRLTAQL